MSPLGVVALLLGTVGCARCGGDHSLSRCRWPGFVPAALVMLALTGCATTERLVTVNVPVPVECRETEPTRPAMDTETLNPTARIDEQSRAMRVEIEIREIYEDRLRTALRNCIAPIQH